MPVTPLQGPDASPERPPGTDWSRCDRLLRRLVAATEQIRILRRRSERLDWRSRADMRGLLDPAEQRTMELRWQILKQCRDTDGDLDDRLATLEQSTRELAAHLLLLAETIRGRSVERRNTR